MSTLKTLQHEIESLAKRVSEDQKQDRQELLDFYQEWCFLREDLYNHLLEAEHDYILQNLRIHLQTYQLLQEAILNKFHDEPKEMEKWLRQRVESLEEYTRTLMRDVNTPQLLISAQLQAVAEELLFLKRISHLVHSEEESILEDILNEVYYLVNQSHESAELFEHPTINQGLANLREKALGIEVGVFELRIKNYLEHSFHNRYQLWQTLHWGSAVQPNISRKQQAHSSLLETCQRGRHALKNKIQESIEQLEMGDRVQELEKYTLELLDRIDDTLVGVERKALPIAIKSLEVVLEDSQWFAQILKRYRKQIDFPDSLKKAHRKLKRKIRSLAREVQNKKIQWRLENIFNKKFVKYFENLILILIFAVILLLVVEELYAFSDQTRQIFMWMDTGICFVLLFEFFLKLSLAEGKAAYFWRHWFTEFLPSLPFGLATHIYGDHLTKIHFLRGVRLIRLIRFIRFFRVITFFLRGSDRLVRHYGRWLNRNIVFFGSVKERKKLRQPKLREKIQELRSLSLNRSRVIFRRIHQHPEQKIPFLLVHMETLASQMKGNDMKSYSQKRSVAAPPILIEDVIQNMLLLRGLDIEKIMGREFPARLYNYFRFFHTPLVRHLPGIRQIVAKHKETEPTEFTAWLGRMIGRMCQRALSIAYWVIDLYGVINAPRILDRLGTTLVDSFKRPAKKLLIFGGSFVAADMLFQASEIELLKTIASFMDRFIGTPLFIIGGICTLPLLLGIWLRHIAGEATEFFLRTSEAQFINLLEDLKLVTAEQDVQILYQRVLQPELALVWGEQNCPSLEAVRKNWHSELFYWGEREKISTEKTHTLQKLRDWNRQQQVLLIYRDYLDGAPLHRSDMKTTEQLLGNIALDNLRTHRLRYTKKEQKSLDRLDLENNKTFFGPYLWFSFITQSIAHNTASLIVEYNKHAIPKSLLSLQPQEKVMEYRRWLNQRLGKEVSVSSEDREQRRRQQKIDTHPQYMTTRFNALHFLTKDAEQDMVIRLSFGEKLFQVFQKDRRELVRHIFGTYPVHLVPQAQRTFNPYELYQNYLAGGLILLFPFRLIGLFFYSFKLFCQWVYQKVREVLNPSLADDEKLGMTDDFNVAVRKINRMRKPVFVEAMKLRARFDFEYLGLQVDGLPGLGVIELPTREEDNTTNSLGTFEEDLDFIQALDSERDYFYALYKERKHKIKDFNTFIQDRGWHQQEQFRQYLKEIDEALVTRSGEILRSLAIAYTIDYQDLPSLLNATNILKEFFDEAIAIRSYVGYYPLRKKITCLLHRMFKTGCFLWVDRERKDFEVFWQAHYSERSSQEKRWCWRTYLVHRRRLQPALYFITESGDPQIAEEIIHKIIYNPTPWAEELLALRTVQTLTVLDVLNYREHIAKLGEYQVADNTG